MFKSHLILSLHKFWNQPFLQGDLVPLSAEWKNGIQKLDLDTEYVIAVGVLLDRAKEYMYKYVYIQVYIHLQLYSFLYVYLYILKSIYLQKYLQF